MTKVRKNLKIQLLDFEYFNGDNSLDLIYTQKGVQKKVHLTESDLLTALYDTNIINTFEGTIVEFTTVDDFYNPAEIDGHRQYEESYELELENFMEDFFTEEDAFTILLHLEESKRTKRLARYIANRVQKSLTTSLHP